MVSYLVLTSGARSRGLSAAIVPRCISVIIAPTLALNRQSHVRPMHIPGPGRERGGTPRGGAPGGRPRPRRAPAPPRARRLYPRCPQTTLEPVGRHIAHGMKRTAPCPTKHPSAIPRPSAPLPRWHLRRRRPAAAPQPVGARGLGLQRLVKRSRVAAWAHGVATAMAAEFDRVRRTSTAFRATAISSAVWPSEYISSSPRK